MSKLKYRISWVDGGTGMETEIGVDNRESAIDVAKNLSDATITHTVNFKTTEYRYMDGRCFEVVTHNIRHDLGNDTFFTLDGDKGSAVFEIGGRKFPLTMAQVARIKGLME